MNDENEYILTVKENEDGLRMDKILSAYLPDISRSYLVKIIEDGNTWVNGKQVLSKKEKLLKGDTVRLIIPNAEPLSVEAENIPIDIVYEDEDVLVVNKPKGMVVHPGPGNWNGTLVNALMYHCRDDLSSINGIIRPGIVHRIDKDTSGLLMVAKNDASHRYLAEQLAEHSIKRAYRCIVYNSFREDEGTIDAPIGRDPKNRLRQAVTEKNSRNAVTHYKVLEKLGRFSLVEAHLETGRTHQIRVHMSHIGHPLLGDPVYGPKKIPFGIKGQMLHAFLLGFVHPAEKKYMEFKAGYPAEFKEILEKLRNTK